MKMTKKSSWSKSLLEVAGPERPLLKLLPIFLQGMGGENQNSLCLLLKESFYESVKLQRKGHVLFISVIHRLSTVILPIVAAQEIAAEEMTE